MTQLQAVDVASFASAQLELLEAELQADLQSNSDLLSHASPKSIERAGGAVLNLRILNQRTGLGGKTVLELELDNAVSSGDGNLPEHGIRTGDIVSIQEQPKGNEKKKEAGELKRNGVSCVIVKVNSQKIQAALDHDVDRIPEGRLWAVKLANDVTYKRMNQTMLKLQKMPESEYSIFIRVMFGHTSPSPLATLSEDVEFTDPSLNDSQKHAVRSALAAKEISLIHGPPGTGKTHTIIELILQLLKEGKKILVCGPSNVSVDNIVERLAPHKLPMVRLGHPARLLPSVLHHSLDILTRNSNAAEIVKDIRMEMDDKQKDIRKSKNGRQRKAIYGELKELRKEFRDRENRCVGNIVQSCKVVLATLHGSGGRQLFNERFDVVIIDEASQALEAQCWIPLLSASKAVLAGDHLQLPPTIKSKIDKKKKAELGMSLETTLFDRLLAIHGPAIKTMLTTQYRMHQTIMQFPSEELYDSELVAAPNVAQRLLKDLEYEVQENEDTLEPLVFWDTQGGQSPERAEEDEGSLTAESKSNHGEVRIVADHVQSLVDAGVRCEDIAVITPYNAQLSLLSQELKSKFVGIELGSVDGFQGREKEAVIVSLVRSNEAHEVGFLGERRRLNVAMTRPKRHLCIVGDSETVGRGSSFLKRWIDFLEAHADLRYPS